MKEIKIKCFPNALVNNIKIYDGNNLICEDNYSSSYYIFCGEVGKCYRVIFNNSFISSFVILDSYDKPYIFYFCNNKDNSHFITLYLYDLNYGLSIERGVLNLWPSHIQ